MNIYLFRHGIAEEWDGSKPDGDRQLIPEGREKIRQEANGLKKLGVSFDVILTSPLARARQTAEIVAEVLDGEKKVRLCDELINGGSSKKLLQQLQDLAKEGKKDAALFGHEPSMGCLVGFFLGYDLSLPLKKGGVCKITISDFDAPQGELRWFLSPRQLVVLGNN